MTTLTPEMLREYSAREMAKLVGRSPAAVAEDFKSIPAAWRDKRDWHCPLWAYQQFQAERGQR
mgnify:CR=1 FL=1